MRTLARRALPPLLLLLAGCSGNGQGLDANGNLVTDSGSGSSGPITADFQSIQDHVFTPICAQCHAGANAPEGLQLTEDQSYDMIVGVHSQEVPALFRISPGDPDNSYLVQKIEGVAQDGAQMPDGCPLLQPCLDQTTIDAIREWVSKGAPPAAGTSISSITGAI